MEYTIARNRKFHLQRAHCSDNYHLILLNKTIHHCELFTLAKLAKLTSTLFAFGSYKRENIFINN